MENGMSRPSPRRQRLAALAVAGVAALANIAMGAPASGAPIVSPHVLGGSLPQWLSEARQVGHAAADRVNFGVLLKMRDPSGAESALADISDPASADYGAWLTNSQFQARFAPAASDVAAV